MRLGEGSYPLAITRANLAPSGVGLSNLITVQVNCLRLQVPTTVPVRVNAFEYGVVIVTFILAPVGYGRRMNLNSSLYVCYIGFGFVSIEITNPISSPAFLSSSSASLEAFRAS